MSSIPNSKEDRPLTAADLAALRAELVAEIRAMSTKDRDIVPVPLERFRDEVLALYRPPLRARNTFTRARQALNLLADLAGPGATTEALTAELVARVIAARPAGEATSTTRGILSMVRTLCNLAVAQHYLRLSPFAMRKRWLRAGLVSARAKRHHSAEEIARILDLARRDVDAKRPGSPSQWRARRLYALVAILAYTGLRRHEALWLRVEDIDLAGRVIRIQARGGHALKTDGAAAPVPMPNALAVILAEWLGHLPIPAELAAKPPARTTAWNPEGIRDPAWVIPNAYRTGPWTGGPSGRGRPIDRVKRLGERLGIFGVTMQSLRHSWATHAESLWGLSPLVIQRVLRHSNAKTQAHYRHADLANLCGAVQGLSFSGSPPSAGDGQAVDPMPPAAPPEKWRDPKNPSQPGVWHGWKLTFDDVFEMRSLRAAGWNYTQLRERYGISKSTLHAALHGFTHKGVPMPRPPAEGA